MISGYRNLLIIGVLIISCKSYMVKEVHFRDETKILKATIEKIDSSKNYYIYLLKDDTLNAVFSKPKICAQKTLGSNIILGRQYSLLVKTKASEMYEYLTRGQSLFPIEDEYFEYEEKVLFIEDCLNICGKTIK